MKKYEFTGETKEVYGVKLNQIRRLSDGEIGGWIEKEENLSHEGDCWVSWNAKVYGNARISGNASVCGNAWVYGNARVYRNAWVSGDAWVCGDARVYGNAKVSENALVYENAWVSGDAWVYGNAWVSGDARVYGDASVSGDARVYGNAKVSGNALVFENAQVYGDAKVSRNAKVSGNALVYGNARISEDAPDEEIEQELDQEATPMLGEPVLGWAAIDDDGNKYKVTYEFTGETEDHRNGSFGLVGTSPGVVDKMYWFRSDGTHVLGVQPNIVFVFKDNSSAIPDFPEEYEHYAFATKEDKDLFHHDHVRVAKEKIGNHEYGRVRYFYQNSDIEKGNFYQLTETDDGYTLYMKSPVDETAREIHLDHHEMAVFSNLFQLASNEDAYKILKEVKK